MGFGFGTIIKILTNSSLVAGTVSSLIKQYKTYKRSNNAEDYQEEIDIQTGMIKKLESELYKANYTISSLRRSVRTLSILAAAAVILSLAAIIMSIIAVT